MAQRNWMIRPLHPDEWVLFRDVRIRAVTDAPDAFGAVLEDVLGKPVDYWRNFTAGFSSPMHVLLVGFVDAEAIGTTYARLTEDGSGHIGAMWIDRRHRRSGLGQQLLHAGIDWLEANGARAVRLWVTEGNEPATALYRANGFTMAGAREPLREGSPLYRLLMERVA